jgi:Ca2+-binding RTX toxin-like protein
LRSGDGLINGDAGADRFELSGSGFEAHGGLDNDVFNIRGGVALRLYADDGADRFNFAAAVTNAGLRGGNGDDNFNGYGFAIAGNILGDAGYDLFDGFSNAAGGVSLRGGTGNDTYRYFAGSSAVFVELANQGTDYVRVSRGVTYTLPDNFENVTVVSASDSTDVAARIDGNTLNNVIIAHDNDDTLVGWAGNDRLLGGFGTDTLHAGPGDDYVDGGYGNDILRGNDGDDVLVGRQGVDSMQGSTGNDTYFIDNFDFVAELVGEGTDTIRLGFDAYVLPDNVENGILTGGGGFLLTGNALDNALYGNTGHNHIIGGAGNDTIRDVNGNDWLEGNDGADILIGGADSDALIGGAGDDILYGNAGLNNIQGGDGDDRMYGGADGDSFHGGAGVDIMPGYAGQDRWYFYAPSDSSPGAEDLIPDFTPGGTDVIDLYQVDADSTVAGNQDFLFSDTGPTGSPRALWITSGGANTYIVHGDVNGDSVADLQFTVIVTGGVLGDNDIFN